MAPKLNLAGLMDVRVRAGQPIYLEIDYEGEPDPTASWKIDDKTFTGTDRAELKTTDHKSAIDIIASVRSDSGSYSITVQNEYGTGKNIELHISTFFKNCGGCSD